MTLALTIFGVYLLTLPLTSWLLFLAVMALKRCRDDTGLPKPVERLAKGVLIAGLVQDLILTATWGTVLFLDWPREGTFTGRLKRYHESGGWRNTRAMWFCTNLLNPFDPSGKHC